LNWVSYIVLMTIAAIFACLFLKASYAGAAKALENLEYWCCLSIPVVQDAVSYKNRPNYIRFL